MQRITRWEGADLYNLLNLTTEELMAMYGYGRKYIATQRHRKRKEIKEGKIPMPPTPEQQPEEFDRMLQEHGINPEGLGDVAVTGFHIGYIRNAEGQIEYTKPLPNVRMVPHKREPELSDFLSQADPLVITPSDREPADRNHRLIVAFSDSQIDYREIDGVLVPIHDERALTVVRMFCRDVRPETIVNLGDTLDLAALSRFPADSNHFQHSMQPAINRVHRLYAELRADNPDSRIVEVDSNHNTRLRKFVLKNFPQADLMQQAGTEGQWPVLSYPFLVNLDAVGVEWISGYGAAEFVYGAEYDTPPIVFKHGNTVVSNGSTAAKESKANPETHLVRGHGHRIETHYRTTRSGLYLGSIMVGATCSTTGSVPSYHSAVSDRGQVVKTQEDWQQGLLLIEDHNGQYNFIHIPIHQGRAAFRGKEYISE